MVLVAYTKSSPEALYQKFYSRVTLNGSLYQESGPSYTLFSYGKNLSGYKNPDWRNIVKNGGNATTPLTASELLISKYAPAYISGRVDVNPTTRYEQYAEIGNLISEDTYDSSLLSTVDNLARTFAIRKLSSSFKGLTFLGELSEAVHMIRHPASGLRKGLDSYLRNAKKIRDRTQRTRAGLGVFKKAIADSWLEYAFGWAPLVKDIQAGFDVLNDRVSRPEYVPFKVSVTRDRQTPRRNVGTGGFQFFSWDAFRSSKEVCSAYYQGTAKVFCTTSGLPEKLGLFPSEFVPTAWELTPWSFLIDYFTNIGDVLDCWATVQRLTYGYVSNGTRKLVTSEVDMIPRFTVPGVGKTISSSSNGSVVVSRKSVTRSSLTSIPLPQFGLKFKLSDSKLLNIAALLAGKRSDSQFKAR